MLQPYIGSALSDTDLFKLVRYFLTEHFGIYCLGQVLENSLGCGIH